VRLFVAVDPAPQVTARIDRVLAEDLRPRAPSARWVSPGSLHLTLTFLGDTYDGAAPDIAFALTKVASAHARFSLRFRGGGSFGATDRPRILWAGVEGDLAALAALQRATSAALQPLGYKPEERRFHPHLTLGRARDPRGDAALAACVAHLAHLAHLAEDFGETTVTSLVLYQSILAREGARYDALAVLPLA
jgi:RNA 2',3'-cyclic 3'-phosphodiesterase